MTWAPHPDVLPDLPGLVHGIKGREPWRVQCDGCAEVFTSAGPLLMAARAVTFKAHSRGDHRRMCSPCWKSVGVTEAYHGVQFADSFVPYSEPVNQAAAASTLAEVVAEHGFDQAGVDAYIATSVLALEAGNRPDPSAIRRVRKAWPSRFDGDGAYRHAVESARWALAPFVALARGESVPPTRAVEVPLFDLDAAS